MVNDVQVFDPNVFGTGGQDPAFNSLPQDEKLSDGIGVSFPIIHITGSKWSLQYKGERKPFIRADDRSPLTYLDVVILRKSGHKTKTWYPAGTFNQETAIGKRPPCSSRNGKTPDIEATEPQSEFCMTCERNKVKPTPDGRRRKECQDYINLSVLLMPNMTTPLYGQPLLEPTMLRVPPDSLTNLANLGDQMSQQGFHFASYVTRMTFDQTVPHPKIIFKAVQKLTGAEAQIVLPLREELQSLRITCEDDSSNVSGPKLVPSIPPAPARVETGLVEAKASTVTAPVTGNIIEMVPQTGDLKVTPVAKELDDKIASLLKTVK